MKEMGNNVIYFSMISDDIKSYGWGDDNVYYFPQKANKPVRFRRFESGHECKGLFPVLEYSVDCSPKNRLDSETFRKFCRRCGTKDLFPVLERSSGIPTFGKPVTITRKVILREEAMLRDMMQASATKSEDIGRIPVLDCLEKKRTEDIYNELISLMEG